MYWEMWRRNPFILSVYVVIVQLCGGVKVGSVWTFLSSFLSRLQNVPFTFTYVWIILLYKVVPFKHAEPLSLIKRALFCFIFLLHGRSSRKKIMYRVTRVHLSSRSAVKVKSWLVSVLASTTYIMVIIQHVNNFFCFFCCTPCEPLCTKPSA